MKKILLSVLILAALVCIKDASAQIFIGARAGYKSDDDGQYIKAAPVLGYKLFIVRAGVFPSVSFDWMKNAPNKYTYGGGAFTQLDLLFNVFAHGEFEFINIETKNRITNNPERVWIDAFHVGAGYRHRLNRNLSLSLTVLYDIRHDERNPSGPFSFRIGVGLE